MPYIEHMDAATGAAAKQRDDIMNNTDNAIVNLPLEKRGNIDAQIDAYKAKLAKEETKQPLRNGVIHLFKGGMPRVFANMTQAQNAAARTGGEAYKSYASGRFMVRYA